MATPAKAPDVVGMAEFARLAGVAKPTVASWMSRGTSPELPPHAELACGPVWRRPAVLSWIADRQHQPRHARV